MNPIDFKPSYVWPDPVFPFRLYLDHPNCRIFIIENIAHNWNWLNQYATRIRESDYFFVYCGWYQSEHFAIESDTIFKLLNLKRQNFYFLFNSQREKQNFQPYGFDGDIINHNAWLDENFVFKPKPLPKIYSAVYVGRLRPFKRHFLAAKVPNLALVAGDNYSPLKSDPPPCVYQNKQPLDPESVSNIINSSHCGLILSDSEGACFSSSEYLLCGVPVVSTESTGGRDFWYDEHNSIICKSDPDSVAAAVERAVNGSFDPELIRTRHVQLQHIVRQRFISQLRLVFQRFSVDLDPEDFFVRTYIHKLRGSMRPDFDSIFPEPKTTILNEEKLERNHLEINVSEPHVGKSLDLQNVSNHGQTHSSSKILLDKDSKNRIITSSPLMGGATEEYFFHTAFCYAPFVCFDLSEVFYIDNVVVENRENPKPHIAERIKDTLLLTSLDLINWEHASVSISSDFMKLVCHPKVNARFLMLRQLGAGIIHVKRIIIFKSLPVSDGLSWINGRFGFVDNNQTYHATYNNGFFSICSQIILDLLETPIKPKAINAKNSFIKFKDTHEDPWPHFFSSPVFEYELPQSDALRQSNPYNKNYNNIDFSLLNKYISTYFRPSKAVTDLIDSLVSAYSIDYSMTVAVCYRGTDKHTEVNPTDPNEYLQHCLSLKQACPNLRFLIQTDQYQIREKFLGEIDNSFCIQEMPVTKGNTVIHDIINFEKLKFSQHLLAVTYIMSKCRHVVTHTGGVAYFTALFRGNLENFQQF